MALEPAGISLEAQNFNDYVKKLARIDNLQQAVFDVDGKKVTIAFDKASSATKKYERGLKEAQKNTKSLGVSTVSAGNLASSAIDQIVGAVINLGTVTARTFTEIIKGGVALNQQFELSEKVFTNVFGDPQLGKATVDFLNETADSLRIGRKEAASFAQTILPRTGGLNEFTELLRLTDIQADTTGQSISELEFSIREALSGDFVSLKDRFDLGSEQINRIKELTPELGRSQALITILTEEFERLGKTDISGTLGANIKDLQSTFTSLQATLGKPTFDQLRIQSENLLDALDRNEEGLNRTAIALGEVVGNVVELVGTELISFINSLDFASIEVGIKNLNAFVEALRVVAKTTKIVFETGAIQATFGLLTGDIKQLSIGLSKLKDADFGQTFKDIGDAVNQASERQKDYVKTVNDTANAQSNLTDENRQAIDDFLASSAAADQAAQALKGYEDALKRVEQLQLSFARAAEDAAIKLARANEDIARKQAQNIAKLQERQAKDRDKLLKNQAKQLDSFEKSRQKQIAKAETDARKARQEASEQRKRDQQKLQRDLQRERERFNLSQLQSERRFSLSERRLRAEGDILALQQLREDRDLERQEEKENFALSQKNQVQSAKEQQREQTKDLESRVNELKSNLEEQRAELLQSFDEQLIAQQQAQAEARLEQQRGFEEAAAERAIQLQREEEDRRRSQARQLEDLGRSLADQQGVTAEGVEAIAGELEKVFGMEGVADSIFKGFKERTENDFKDLFENIEGIVGGATPATPSPLPLPVAGRTPAGIPAFGGGGIVDGPGPIGSPQIIQAHKGEAILNQQQQRSFTMTAPVIPSQVLEVAMSGGFNITGDNQADEAILRAATHEMTENFKIAIGRIARRN